MEWRHFVTCLWNDPRRNTIGVSIYLSPRNAMDATQRAAVMELNSLSLNEV